jgi:hypothetical protein
MGKTKKEPIDGSAKGTLPLDARLTPEKMVSTVNTQLANVQACADYTNQQGVEAACTTLKGSLGALVTLLTNLSNARALVSSLETQRDAQCSVVRRDHATLQGAINTASQGQVAKLEAWGATPVARSILALSTDPPLDVVGQALGSGLWRGQCKLDPAAKCYLFQIGTDPTNPGAWAPPVVSNGCRHTFSATPGQKVYFRLAVQRRKSGQGQWSDIIEVTVR